MSMYLGTGRKRSNGIESVCKVTATEIMFSPEQYQRIDSKQDFPALRALLSLLRWLLWGWLVTVRRMCHAGGWLQRLPWRPMR